MIKKLEGNFGAFLSLLMSAPFFAHANEVPEPVYANVKMEGYPYEGENCEGGDWTLNWKGPVHVEPGPIADLLMSYTAFDTSHPGQRPIPSVTFNSKQVICRDNDGKVVMTAKVNQKNSNKVQLTVSLAQNAAYNSPAFIFSADEMGVCKVDANGASFDYPNVMASIHTGMLNAITPALDITLADLQKGFNKTYQFDGTVIGIPPMCMGGQLKRGSVNLRYKSGTEDPTVAMDACLHLAKDEIKEIIAQGSPANGTYQFTSNPADTLAIVSQQKNTAKIHGKTPGKGEVSVEYRYQGKTASTTVAGSVVELVSVNNGGNIPKLGLYDVNGKKVGITYSFPLKLNPLDGYVQMTLENDVLASVANTASNIQIQPFKLGKTLMQAKTLCGSKIGSPIPIEIVRCDDEVQKQLQTKKEEHKRRLDTLVSRITSMLADTEFQRASTEIRDTTKDMAIKTGESIINTLTFGRTKQVEFAKAKGILLSKDIIVNAQRLDVVGNVWDAYNTVNDAYTTYTETPKDVNAHIKYAVGAAVLAGRNSAIALGKTYGESYLAAKKFGTDLGIIAGVADQLAELEPQHDKLIKEYIHISDHLAFCEKSPPPKPEEPTPPKPTPTEDDETDIPIEELPAEEIPVEEEPKPEEPKEPPKAEDPPKKTYGLACRIQDLKAPGAAQHLRELKQLYQAQQQSLEKAQATLKVWQTALEKMEKATAGTEAEFVAELPAFKQAQDQFLLQTAQHGYSSLEFMQETDECPERLQIKLDQVRARYN